MKEREREKEGGRGRGREGGSEREREGGDRERELLNLISCQLHGAPFRKTEGATREVDAVMSM